MIHAQFITRTTELGVGNHSLMDGGRPVSTQPLDRVRLCHYPVRSVAQYERASTEILLLQDRLSQLQRELAASQQKAEKQAEQISELNNKLVTSQQTGENLAKQLSQLQIDLVNSQHKTDKQALQLSQMQIELVDSQHRVDKQTQQLSHLQSELLNSQEKIASQARQLQSRTFRILTPGAWHADSRQNCAPTLVTWFSMSSS